MIDKESEEKRKERLIEYIDIICDYGKFINTQQSSVLLTLLSIAISVLVAYSLTQIYLKFVFPLGYLGIIVILGIEVVMVIYKFYFGKDPEYIWKLYNLKMEILSEESIDEKKYIEYMKEINMCKDKIFKNPRKKIKDLCKKCKEKIRFLLKISSS